VDAAAVEIAMDPKTNFMATLFRFILQFVICDFVVLAFGMMAGLLGCGQNPCN